MVVEPFFSLYIYCLSHFNKKQKNKKTNKQTENVSTWGEKKKRSLQITRTAAMAICSKTKYGWNGDEKQMALCKDVSIFCLKERMDFERSGYLRTCLNLHKDFLFCLSMDGWRYRAQYQLQLNRFTKSWTAIFFSDTDPLYLCSVLYSQVAQAPWGPIVSFNYVETQRKYLKVCMGMTVKIAYLQTEI